MEGSLIFLEVSPIGMSGLQRNWATSNDRVPEGEGFSFDSAMTGKTEEIAYLKALKMSAASDSSTVTQTRDGADASAVGQTAGEAGASYGGPEKRRSRRLKCEGSVRMRETGCDVDTWASFTDVSMHGCYVEAQATYPVGTTLELKLEVNQFKIETKGNVRVCYPYLGMGIAFVETSVENQARLKELLASITRARMLMGPSRAAAPLLPMESMPEITSPKAALHSLMEFFQTHPALLRDDFLRLIRTSQQPTSKS
jgi:hypothetical protein